MCRDLPRLVPQLPPKFGWFGQNCVMARATIYRLLADAGMPQKKQLAEGTKVKVAGAGEAGVVTHAHEVDGDVPMVDVRFEGEVQVN